MANRLTKLKLTKVALCHRGMNQYADMVLFKSADSPKIAMDSDMPPLPKTTGERLAVRAFWEAWDPLWFAFTDSIHEALYQCTQGHAAENTPIILQSIDEFQAEAVRILGGLGLMEKAAPVLEVLTDVRKAGRVMSAARMAQLRAAIATLQTILTEAGGKMEKGTPMAEKPDDLSATVAVLQANLLAKNAEIAQLTAALSKAQETPEEQEAAFMKTLPESVRKKWEAEALEKAALKADLALEKAKREQSEYIEKAASYRAVGLAPDDWEVLKALDTLPEAARDRVLQLFKAAGEQLKKSALFSEVGPGRTQSGAGPETEIQSLIAVEVAKGLTPRDALSVVARTNPELYRAYTEAMQHRSRVSSS